MLCSRCSSGIHVHVNGISYYNETPKEVINLLEDSRKNKKRISLTFGDKDTGEVWGKEKGIVGSSTGTCKIPLVIKTKRSLGGEAILDDCILKIVDSNGKVTYSHERAHV